MDAVERTNQLHTLEIGAVKLGEHGLKLRTEEHTHDRCLDDITEVMAQSDLIAAQLFCLAVKMPPTHPSAEVAGRGIAVVGNLENICFKDGDGNFQQGRIALDLLAVDGIVPRVHDQIDQLKGKVAVPLKQLHELGQEHRIFTTRDADGDLIPRLDEFVMLDGIGEGTPELFSVFFMDTALDPLTWGQLSTHGGRGSFLRHVLGNRRQRPVKIQ